MTTDGVGTRGCPACGGALRATGEEMAVFGGHHSPVYECPDCGWRSDS